jgi:hypothetical protein
MQVMHFGRQERSNAAAAGVDPAGVLSYPATVTRRELASERFGNVVWDQIYFERVAIPRIKHLMILQGAPLSQMFHERGLILLSGKLDPLWRAPLFYRRVYLAGVVTVNGETPETVEIGVGAEMLGQIRLDPIVP